MEDYIKKMVNNPNIPAMSRAGLIEIIDYLTNNKETYKNSLNAGPSRHIMIAREHKDEPKMSFEQKLELEKLLLKKIILKISEELKINPNFIQTINLKSGRTLNAERKDYDEIIELAKQNEIEKILETKLGQFFLNEMANFETEHVGPSYFSMKTLQPTKPKKIIRIYINTSTGKNATEFLYHYIDKCLDNNLYYDFKGIYNINKNRSDITILYVPIECLNQHIQILYDIQNEFPSLIETFGSPLATAHNEAFFAVGQNWFNMTYNNLFDLICYEAYYTTFTQIMLRDFGDELTEKQKEDLKKSYLSPEKVSNLNFLNIKRKMNYFIDDYDYFIKKILQSNKNGFINEFEANLKICMSITNFNDTNHTDFPICFPPEFLPKKTVKQEDKPILSIDQINKMISNNEQIYLDNIILDNDCIISILCSNLATLKRYLIHMGYKSSDIILKKREPLEKLFIEKVGLDKTIEASEYVMKNDKNNGTKRNHIYGNTLQAMRLERGKTLCESEEFKSAKTNEEKENFAKSLSKYALADALNYMDTVKNIKNSVDDIVRII